MKLKGQHKATQQVLWDMTLILLCRKISDTRYRCVAVRANQTALSLEVE